MEMLLRISFSILVGLFMSRATKVLKLPAVTGYLVAGILIGPYCLGLIGINGLGFNNMAQVTELTALSQVALGFIAFSIGNEFRLSQLKAIGKQATIVGIFQAVVTTLLIDAVLIGLHFILGPDKLPLSVAITLGAIGSATAPAATLMVVKQYKAKGKLTDILLPVVAIDDAVGLVLFAVSFGVAKTLESGSVSVASVILEPIIEVVISLVFGAVLGFIFSYAERAFESNSKRTSLSISFIIIAVAISMLKFEIGGIHIGFSSLLVCMMFGTIFCNMCSFSGEIMEKVDKWSAPLLVLFFVTSGAELELGVFTELVVVGIGLVYILSRSVGKYLGAYSSCALSKCDPSVTKYLGITLLPQAGVALGMSITASELGAPGALIRNIVLFAVMIYELVGPTLTKISLMKSGDISPKVDSPRKTHLKQEKALKEAKKQEKATK